MVVVVVGGDELIRTLGLGELVKSCCSAFGDSVEQVATG